MNNNPQEQQVMLVSFSGIDGSGKSTQIANLRARLQEAGLNVQLITFWDDVATLKGIREGAGHKLFKGDKGVGTPEAPIHRRDKNVRSPLITMFRMAIYISDAISLRKMTNKAQQLKADVVIFDRYLYDELANLNLENAAIRAYIRAVMKLVPRPTVSLVIDADPVKARARKPEYPIEFLHSNRNSYLRLSQILGKITVIPSASLENMKADVVQCVLRESFARHTSSNEVAYTEDKMF